MKRLLIQPIFRTSFLKSNTNCDKSTVNLIRFITKQSYIGGSPHKQTITAVSPKDMSLRYCSPIPSITIGDDPEVQALSMTTTRRPLTIILAWMLAQDKHLEKYRQLWFKRGFDVLTVKTSPIDLLVPPIGGQVVAKNLIKYLSEISPQFYREIVIHAFSVGGYQYGEMLLKLNSSDEYKDLSQSFKGIIIDSMVHADDCPPGLSRAVTHNPIIQPLLELSIKGFLKLTKKISLDNYRKSSNQIFTNPLKLPGLLLYSRDDVVSESKNNEKLAQSWSQLGIPVQSKCWSHSTHVLHYRDHQFEYEQQLDHFLRKLKLKSGNV